MLPRYGDGYNARVAKTLKLHLGEKYGTDFPDDVIGSVL